MRLVIRLLRETRLLVCLIAGLTAWASGPASAAGPSPVSVARLSPDAPRLIGESDLSGTSETFVVKYDHPPAAGKLNKQNVCRTGGPCGTWETSPTLYDLYGDGRLESAPHSERVKMGGVTAVVNKFVKDSPGLQGVFWHDWYSNAPTAYLEMLSYDKRGAPPRLVWRSSPKEGGVYETLTLAVDANNDGQPDLATATHLRVMVWDGATGKKIMEVRPPYQRNYGTFGYTYVQGSPYPIFFTLVDFQSHFDVYGNDGKSLSVLWREDVESPEILRNHKFIRVGPRPVASLFGDSRKQLVFNYFSRTGDGQWHVMGYDLQTGRIVLDLKGTNLAGAADLDGDGREELFVRKTEGLKYHAPADLMIYGNVGGHMRPIWTLPGAVWVTHTVTPEPNIMTIATEGKITALTGDFTGTGRQSFFAIQGAEAGRRLRGFTMGKDRSIEESLTAEFRDAKDLAVTGMADIDGDGARELRVSAAARRPLKMVWADQRVKKMTSGALAGPFPSGVVARRRKGLPVIAACAPTREVVGLELRRGRLKELWRRPGRGGGSERGRGSSQLIAADLVGGGEMSIAAASKSPDGSAMVQAWDPNGKTQWEKIFSNFDGDPASGNVGGLTALYAGHFTDPRRVDILVAFRRAMMHSDEGRLLDGRSGRELWQCDATGDGNGVRYGFLGGAAMAADVDGDGLDEIITSYPCNLAVFKGATGRQTVGLDLARWTYYSQVAAAGPDELGRAQILVTAGSVTSNIQRMLFDGAGTELWRSGLDGSTSVTLAAWTDPAAGQHGSSSSVALDINGDGKTEILSVSREWDSIRILDPKSGKVTGSLGSDLPFVPKEYKVVGPIGGFPNGLLCVRDRKLAALGVEARGFKTLWTYEFPVAIRSPLAADLDGDGRMEILVSGAGGKLYVLGTGR